MTVIDSPDPTPNSSSDGTSEAWLNRVFDRYQRPLVAYAWRLLNGDIETAKDCVQDTFLALCKQSRSTVEGHVEAWLFKTCRNRAIDHQRRRKSMITTASSGGLEQAEDHGPNPARTATLNEEQLCVEAAVKKLPSREQELLTMRLTHELSYKQIASITGLSVSNVGFLLHQAISRLREVLPTAKS